MDVGLLILRVVLGGVFIGHGTQKLFGWFGGPGRQGFGSWLASMGYRPEKPLALLAGLAEAGGGASLALGFITPLGAAAIIARSFARIHESNLKEQGVLPLTFADPAGYDLIRAKDRVSLMGLKELAPGKEVMGRVRHADGTEEALSLRHTLNPEQIEWFKAGSALNLLRKREGSAR